MYPDEHEHVIHELETLIHDTQDALNRFESSGMDALMQDDYDKLLDVLDNAVKQQQQHTLAMLDADQ